MEVSGLIVNVNSEQPDKVGAFYREVVGLKPNPNIGQNAFEIGNANLIIDGHSQVKGATKEPARMLLDFFVDDLAAEQKRLEAAGVKFIRTAGKEEWGGIISTFLDPDGNYCQIIEYKP